MDVHFEPLHGDLADMGIQLNTVSNDEHVPEIERQIRTLKERTRGIYCTLPFRKIPRRLIIKILYTANYWLNMFLHKGGISQTMRPRTLLTGLTMNYNRHCRLEFGEYVQTHEEHDNSLNPHTIGALALRPTGNVQGGYFFFSLTTGKVINQMRWTQLPMPKEVVERVERMARQEHAGTTLLFEDRDHNEIIEPDQEDNDNDSDYDPNDDSDDNDNDDDDNNAPPTNQPNEPYEDPGILEEDYVEQDHPQEHDNTNDEDYHPQEHDNTNDEDNNEDADNAHNNGGIDNDVLQDENVPLHPTSNAEIVAENENEEDEDKSMNHHPDEITGVEPKPLPPIQIQNERSQRELNRIAWMGQQPATYAGRTRAQGREHATTNAMTDFERDLFHRRVAGIQLPPEYEDQLANLKHTILTQYTLKKVSKFLDQRVWRQCFLK